MTAVTFRVRALDGECLPVADLDLGGRFSYPTTPSTWSTSRTDANGYARFTEEHAESPTSVALFVGDLQCGSYEVEDGGTIILEL
jgi:hypothetical protein